MQVASCAGLSASSLNQSLSFSGTMIQGTQWAVVPPKYLTKCLGQKFICRWFCFAGGFQHLPGDFRLHFPPASCRNPLPWANDTSFHFTRKPRCLSILPLFGCSSTYRNVEACLQICTVRVWKSVVLRHLWNTYLQAQNKKIPFRVCNRTWFYTRKAHKGMWGNDLICDTVWCHQD